MLDLELRCQKADTIVPIDSLFAEIKLENVDERSLNEQSDKILQCFSDDVLIKELDKRESKGHDIVATRRKMQSRIQDLENALEEIKDCAWGAL